MKRAFWLFKVVTAPLLTFVGDVAAVARSPPPTPALNWLTNHLEAAGLSSTGAPPDPPLLAHRALSGPR